MKDLNRTRIPSGLPYRVAAAQERNRKSCGWEKQPRLQMISAVEPALSEVEGRVAELAQHDPRRACALKGQCWESNK
jgi:hypothetical protein